jgi:signal transduction histidine kinase
MNTFLNIYNGLYQWIIKGTDSKYETQLKEIQRVLVVVLVTAVMMWSYALQSYATISVRLVWVIGAICSTIHLLSPIIFRYYKSPIFITHLFIMSGFIFQYVHCFYTGGFYSDTIIWFPYLPLIAGVCIGVRCLLTWTVISTIGTLSLLYYQSLTSNNVTESGRLWAHLNITFGYIFLNVGAFLTYKYYKDKDHDKLINTNESIRKLLRVIGHDIANPLNVILGRAHMGLHGDCNENQMTHFKSIERSARHIDLILTDTRDLVSLDYSHGKKSKDNILLNDVVKESIFIFKDKIDAKNITIDYDFERHGEVSIYGNSTRIKNQVFNNLFSNAIKFVGMNGIIKIDCMMDVSEIIVKFSDNGVGMSELIRKDLFESDILTTTTGVMGEKGTGFGMPIVHQSLKEMGASIEVYSVEKSVDAQNSGTVFTIRFPRNHY